MPNRLTEEQIAAYDRDGFVAPVDIMPASEALILRQRLAKAEREYPERLNPQNRNNAHYEFRFMDDIVHDPRILDAVEDLIGPDILLWSTVMFIKEARTASHVSFHQDATYMGLEPHIGVTAWLALTESSTRNGCMLMEAGSHRDAIRDHEDTFGEHNILTRGQTIRDVDQSAVTPVELEPGQLSLHHVRTVHASAPNHSNARRIGIALQAFFPPHVVQTKGDSYALVVRGEDNHGNFRLGRRPLADHEPEGVAVRAIANDRFAQILYAGAEKRRQL